MMKPVDAAVYRASERHRAAERYNEEREDEGVIYFIRIGDLIKIGKTLNLKSRLSTYSYPDLELLATEPGLHRSRDPAAQRVRVLPPAGRVVPPVP
jgi:hypothetical protein